MPPKEIETLDVRTLAQWRRWLAKHHASKPEIWLVFHKQHTGVPSIPYLDALDEALCFGWIDSLVRRLDDDRFARKFTPRKPDSSWSAVNRKRYAMLEASGRLQPAGRERAPTERSSVKPPRREWKMPGYMASALEARPKARKTFDNLPPSHRRRYIGWIDSAKREETKMRRLDEALRLLEAGKELGLK